MNLPLEDFLALKTSKSRLLGFDVGAKTLGLSLSDTRWLIATPGTVIKRDKLHLMVKNIHHFIDEERIAGIVVGFPKSLDGSLNKRTQSTIDFMKAMEGVFSYPYIFWDERFTTNAAQRAFQEAHLSTAKRQEKIDAVAACLILQNFLDFCSHKALNNSVEVSLF